MPNTSQIETLVLNALHALKAADLTILNVKDLTTITDTMIICSGRSTRHVVSLAENVIQQAKANGIHFIKSEGQETGEWVIVDLADVIVHVMLPNVREFYKLEDLWEPIKELRETQSL